MKNKNYKSIGKNVIELEINALKKLKKSINESFNQAVNAISNCQSKIIFCGVGKSFRIASKIPNDSKCAAVTGEALPLVWLLLIWFFISCTSAEEPDSTNIPTTFSDASMETYEGVSIPYDTIIVLGLAMDYNEMLMAPDVSAGAHVVKEYTRGMKASKRLASWLRLNGHDAQPEHGPFAGNLPLVPAAIAAGLGELGKHGSVINEKMGSCFRLAAVMTNMKLKHDEPNNFGVDDFCLNCQICSKFCPPDAILHEKKTVRGERKWYVDFDKCLPFFNETAGCGICITVCPFSRPEVRPNLIAKLSRRT